MIEMNQKSKPNILKQFCYILVQISDSLVEKHAHTSILSHLAFDIFNIKIIYICF